MLDFAGTLLWAFAFIRGFQVVRDLIGRYG